MVYNPFKMQVSATNTPRFADYYDPTKEELQAFAQSLGAVYSETAELAVGLMLCRIAYADGKSFERFYDPSMPSVRGTRLAPGAPPVDFKERAVTRTSMRWELENYEYLRPRRVGGVNDAARVACTRYPKTHGFHPASEKCAYCA